MNEINFTTLGFDPTTEMEAETEDNIIDSTLQDIAGRYKYLEDVLVSDKNVQLLLSYSGHCSWDDFCSSFDKIDNYFYRKVEPQIDDNQKLLLAIAEKYPKFADVDEDSIQVMTLLDKYGFSSWSEYVAEHQKECDAVFIKEKTVKDEHENSPRNIRRRVAENRHKQLCEMTTQLKKQIDDCKQRIILLGEKINTLTMSIELSAFENVSEVEMSKRLQQRFMFEKKQKEEHQLLNNMVSKYEALCIEDRVVTSRIAALNRDTDMLELNVSVEFALRLISAMVYTTGTRIFYEENSWENQSTAGLYQPIEPTFNTGGGVYETDDNSTKANSAVNEAYEFYATLQMLYQDFKDRLPLGKEVKPLPSLNDAIKNAERRKGDYIIEKGLKEAQKRDEKRRIQA